MSDDKIVVEGIASIILQTQEKSNKQLKLIIVLMSLIYFITVGLLVGYILYDRYLDGQAESEQIHYSTIEQDNITDNANGNFNYIIQSHNQK